MLTEIVNADTGETLETGMRCGSFVVGETIEVGGVRKTIRKIDDSVPRPNPSAGFRDFYQVIYVS